MARPASSWPSSTRGDPRRPCRPVPAAGALGPQRCRPVRPRVAATPCMDGAPRYGRASGPATSMRGSPAARRAQRGTADGDPRTRGRDPRRDRLGLDIDALRVVANGVREVQRTRPDLGVLLIPHYQRSSTSCCPPRAHPHRGRIVESVARVAVGGPRVTSVASRVIATLDVAAVKRTSDLDFEVHGRRLVYLDSARRRRSRSRSSTRWTRSTRPPTPTCIAVCSDRRGGNGAHGGGAGQVARFIAR